MTDPITDMLNQIRNALAVDKTEILLPYSEIKEKILEILVKENFISEVKKVSKSNTRTNLKIVLKYENGLSVILGLKRVSKPGQRIYQDCSKIKKVHGGYGISIISTPKGLMTGKDAKKQKLGGEVLCEVW